MELRKNDARYLGHVKRWFDTLLPRMAPYLYHRGGPILMTQVGMHVWACQAITSAFCLSCIISRTYHRFTVEVSRLQHKFAKKHMMLRLS